MNNYISTRKEVSRMPKWNAMQQKAIQTKQKNILVSASAGSGKTTVLIARLMDLVIRDQVPIDAILAMTFTEAAANEMKKRLASELQQAFTQAGTKEEKAYITKQLTSMQTAHISTIHSFCLSILQDYYYMINLNPQRISNIMDSANMLIYQKRALKKAFEHQYQKNDTIFIELCQMFSTRPEHDTALEKTIMHLAALASSKPDPYKWLYSLGNTYYDMYHIEDMPKSMYDNFFEYLYVVLQQYKTSLIRIDEIFTLKYADQVKKHAIIKQKLDFLTPLYDALRKKCYESYRSAYIAIVHALIPPSPDKEDSEYTKLRKDILTQEDGILGLLFSESDFIKDMNQLHPYIEKLVELSVDYRMQYANLKAFHNVIDFDDMEHFALEILQTKQHQIANLYREQFVEIMVDEFQDSNDVQNKLVMLICKENNVFRVGDIKQSIYGFRHAKPQLMKSLMEHKTSKDEVIYLSNNYRSKKMIVDFNNELFKRLMNIEGFSCSYTKEDDVETGVASQLERNVPICFHAIFHNELKESEQITLSKNDIKASYIANQIIEQRKNEQRPWKDFVVLVRGNARKDDMKIMFDELQIPCFIDIKHGFYQSNAVQIVLSALKCIQYPHEDIPFVATLLSPFFQLTTMDFANAKIAKKKHQSYYSYFKEHPCIGFETLQEFISDSHHCSLTDMLNKLYNLQDYYRLHTTVQEKTNLDLLFEKAIEFEETQASGILAFLNQIDQIKDAQTAEAIPIGSEADVVRVMSIHQSKGLQFPVVFLWSTDKQTPIEFKEYCLCDSDVGIAMKSMKLPERYIRTTIPRIAMEHKKNKEELEEEMRILYVATTRAQQQMHIVDCIVSLEPYKTPLSLSSVYGRKGYTAWILQSFLSNPSPLFVLKEVHTFWKNEIQPQPHLPVHQPLQTYSYSTPSIKMKTASLEKEEALPPFTLEKQGDGLAYGTMMHKMIEFLSSPPWTKEDIMQVAKEHTIDLRPSDIKTLQALGKDPLYEKAHGTTTYHEFPFMVKVDNEILHGFIDFVSMEDTKITIIDFKTDALSNSQEFIARYSTQLELYKKAMTVVYPQTQITCYIYAFHLHQMIPLTD